MDPQKLAAFSGLSVATAQRMEASDNAIERLHYEQGAFVGETAAMSFWCLLACGQIQEGRRLAYVRKRARSAGLPRRLTRYLKFVGRHRKICFKQASTPTAEAGGKCYGGKFQ